LKLGGKIVIVLAALMCSLYLIEKVFGFGIHHNRNIKMVDIEKSPKNVDLLIHGPCEPLWMISPALLDPLTGLKSYNLSLSHSDFADNYIHLYWYLKYNKAPAYMWFYVTPESFDKRYNTFNSYRFAPYLEDSLIYSVVKEHDPGFVTAARFPLMRYTFYSRHVLFNVFQGFNHYFTGRDHAFYPDGFEPPAKRVWGNHNGEFVELYDENVIFKWDTLREKYFLKTMHLAKQAGIKVFLYESPVLADALPFQPNREAIIGKIRALARQVDVPFIQFQNLDMAKHRKFFVSTLNFNMEGVKLFNDTFARVVRYYSITK
jgi:hypothetical protein